MKKLWLIPLNDKRGEELCTHMYNPFGRFVARFRVRRNIKNLGYSIKKTGKEEHILDKENNLIGKLRTVFFNKHNIEPTVFLNTNYSTPWLQRAITTAGCAFDYLN